MVTSKNRLLLTSVLLILAISTFFFCPETLFQNYKNSYYVICANFVLIIFIFSVVIAKYGIDIFDPFLFATLIHLMLFIITPLICLWTNNILWFGINLWDGCIKGTIISTIGYIAMYLAYYATVRRGKNEMSNQNTERCVVCFDNKLSNQNIILYTNIAVWVVAFICSVFMVMSTGQNFIYMLTLRSSNSSDINELNRSNFQFLGILAYMMVPSYLYVFHFSKSRLFKIILFYLMTMSFVIRGFRFILVAVIIAPIVMTSLIKDRRPRALHVMLVAAILAVMVGFVGYIRNSVRIGSGVMSTNSFGTETIIDAIFGNFEIFKTYYGIMIHIPTDRGFTFGQQIFLYTLIMLIPRAIWPTKPEPVLRKINTLAVSVYANTAGTAYPYIGEYYHEFGILGVVILSFVFGMLLKKLRNFMFKKDIHSIVLFSTLYPLLLQVMIRGYTPSNFYMILAVIIPVVLTKTLIKSK